MNETDNKKLRIPWANVITSLRIAGAAAMVFTKPLTPAFWSLYLICGVSDMLDGPLARRLGTAGKRGTHMDSVADILLGVSLCVLFVPLIHFEKWMIYAAAIIAAVRLAAYAVGGIKYRAMPMLHTISNKLSGLALFSFPLMYRFLGLTATALILVVITAFSSIEELAITIKSRTLDPDVKSIFKK